MLYHLYNNDVRVALFEYDRGVISAFKPEIPELLPMQIKNGSAEVFALWLQERSIDLSAYLHRELMRLLLGSRDKIAVAIATHMFSVTDTFSCFPESEFIPRDNLWNIETQNKVSDFILISSDTSLRLRSIITPNAATDGSFPKTWRFEDGAWWLYKVQSIDASHSEYAVSRAICSCGWDAAEYKYFKGTRPTGKIKTRNFVGIGEFFEPYDSLRYRFDDRRDDDETIYDNIQSLGTTFENAYRRILLADALFMNSDRHMRNFGVIRSAVTGEMLRMAPNYDNNQAYKSNKDIRYNAAMMRSFVNTFGLREEDRIDLRDLAKACKQVPYLNDAYTVAISYL